MGLFNIRRRRRTFSVPVASKAVSGKSILSFLGVNNSSNILSQPLGQLFKNKNMEYLYSGKNIFLRTKRGSTLISDITNRPYGAALYTYNLSNEKFVWIDGTDIKHSDTDGSGEATISSAVSENKETYFTMYGQNENAALYFVNGVDTFVGKISGETPAFSEVSAPAADYIAYSTALGRLFLVKGHFVYASGQQVGAGTANLETIPAAASPTAIVSPDDGLGFKAIVDLGVQGIYFFKDTGIWVLPNGNESDTADWRFPKAEADIGTLSPKTVKAVTYGNKNGIIYLAPDKTLRFLSPQVSSYGAGELPSVTKSDSKIISENFQNTLNTIPESRINECTGHFWGRYYIFCYPSSAGSTQVDKTLILDLDKLFKSKDQQFAQPFMLESVNMNYTGFITRPTNNRVYGFGVDGYIARLFVDNKYVEEIPTRIDVDEDYEDTGDTRSVTIEYEAFTGWYNFGKDMAGDAALELNGLYLNWETFGNYGLTVHGNAFMRGDIIPVYDEGNTGTSDTPEGLGGSWDVGLWDVMVWAAAEGNASQYVRVRSRGHYFMFGFKNTNYNEPASVFGVETMFKQYFADSIGKR